jgi:glutamate-1-semialdehyde 2,1-aminomutase
MAAGIATLRLLTEEAFARLEGLTRRLTSGLADVLTRRGVQHRVDGQGSMFGLFFSDGPVTDLVSAKRSDTARYARFFHALLDRGYYFAPSQFEAGFLSLAHDEAAIDGTIAAVDDALDEVLACR